MSGDKDLVQLLWQVVAASLNGNYSYRKSIWFVGDGNDGKGTFQQMISNLVGFKNVAPLKLNQFSERFGLAIIEGKTVIIGDDVQAGIYVDESSNFNSVVTGEPVSIEKKARILTWRYSKKPSYNLQTGCHHLKINQMVLIAVLSLSRFKRHSHQRKITGPLKMITLIVKKCLNTSFGKLSI